MGATFFKLGDYCDEHLDERLSDIRLRFGKNGRESHIVIERGGDDFIYASIDSRLTSLDDPKPWKD